MCTGCFTARVSEASVAPRRPAHVGNYKIRMHNPIKRQVFCFLSTARSYSSTRFNNVRKNSRATLRPSALAFSLSGEFEIGGNADKRESRSNLTLRVAFSFVVNILCLRDARSTIHSKSGTVDARGPFTLKYVIHRCAFSLPSISHADLPR